MPTERCGTGTTATKATGRFENRTRGASINFDEDALAGLDPHEYHGIALNLPIEKIPMTIVREIARVGHLELWDFQAFTNHDHPFLGGDGSDAESEFALATAWGERLNQRLPSFRFVVQVDPLAVMTWYQATATAPTEDDPLFEEYVSSESYRSFVDENGKRRFVRTGYPPRTGRNGPCEKCGEEGRLCAPFPSPAHRGVHLTECGACGAKLVYATRTIRNVIEPTESRSMP